MKTSNDVHEQFAHFFQNNRLAPFAYLLYKRMQEGHTCIHTQDALLYRDELPYSPPFDVEALSGMQPLVGLAEDSSPFILHKERLYLHRYFGYETQILQAISSMLQKDSSEKEDRVQSLQQLRSIFPLLLANDNIEGVTPEEKTDWQFAAAILGVLHQFTMITGGPGTGKTTTVAKILTLLFHLNPSCKVALAAPTGKAAMRMAESLKQTNLNIPDDIKNKFGTLHPNTIHRLLKYIPNSIYFNHHKGNPLPYDVVIVDEASMIDVALFSKLLDAIGPDTRLILLGDKNQLASVEAGSMFGDLCKAVEATNPFSPDTATLINGFIESQERRITDSFVQALNHPLCEHLIELQKSHRFNSLGGIGKFSKAIIHNNVAVLTEYIHQDTDASVQVDIQMDPHIFDAFIEGYRAYLQETDIGLALQKLQAIRVLCAVRQGPHGLNAVNRAIEQYLQKKNWLQVKGDFYENRPIIITKNYPDLSLYNGDIGILRKDEKGQMRAWFEYSDKKVRPVMPAYIHHAETVFAMTIHKSQGSEYNEVLVILPNQAGTQLLTRELLYTAVTRAKQKVIVQATERVLLETAEASVKRASGIINRFEDI